MDKRSFFGSKKSGLIFAADLPTSKENFEILDEISKFVDVIKISSFITYSEGISIIFQI